MSHITRRSLLRGGAYGAALAFAGPFRGYVAHARAGYPRIAGYGTLAPVLDERGDGVARLELPPGFHYRSFHHAGELLTDGTEIPGRHDGMGAFVGPAGRVHLVRNHEINNNVNAATGSPPDIRLGERPGYDPLAKGGTVTVQVDGRGNVGRSWVSLSGTQMNCSGGVTPWGTWLSCEETVNGDDVGPDFTGVTNAGMLPHGYMFEVGSHSVSNAKPITAAGRFAKEAAAVDPATSTIYITEDSFLFPSGLYRFLPERDPMQNGHLQDRGRLQMLKVVGVNRAHLWDDETDAVYPVEWVDIADPDPDMTGATNNEAIQMVGLQGFAQGAAEFSRLEGAIWWDGRLYFTSTQGGVAADPIGGAAYDVVIHGFGRGRGQVWAYDPATEMLECVYQSPASATLDLPDNVAMSPNGTLVLCEDGSGDNFLRGLTPAGELFTFARNADPKQVGQEFAGAVFSPDGETLYVNIQSSPSSSIGRKGGYSIAIWGPWQPGPF
jgi:secreted PhoX family phosphatase